MQLPLNKQFYDAEAKIIEILILLSFASKIAMLHENSAVKVQWENIFNEPQSFLYGSDFLIFQVENLP